MLSLATRRAEMAAERTKLSECESKPARSSDTDSETTCKRPIRTVASRSKTEVAAATTLKSAEKNKIAANKVTRALFKDEIDNERGGDTGKGRRF